MFNKFSIRKKLILSIFIGCLIPYIFGGVYIKNKAETWLYNNNNEQTNLLLSQKAETVDESMLKNIDNLVSTLVVDERVQNASSIVQSYINYNPTTSSPQYSKSEDELMAYFGSIKDSFDVLNTISIGTEEGRYLEYPSFNPTGPYDPRTRDWYSNAIRGNETIISEPYMTKVTNDMVISLAKSVTSNGKKIGVVCLTIKVDDFMKEVMELEYGESGYVNILSPKNVFINSPANKEWELLSFDDLETDVFHSIDQYNGKFFEGKLDDTDKVFNVYISPYSGWKYISVIDKSEVLKQSNVLTGLLIANYFVIFLIILLCISLISNYITKPILKIAQVINKMATFKFDSYKNENIVNYTYQKDEIGEISRALCVMQENFIELRNNITDMDDEIQNINLNERAIYQLNLSKNNPFTGIARSINGLLHEVHSSFEKINLFNEEISSKNRLLESSKKELTAQLIEIDEQNEHIRFIAEHDSLTNLPNRRKFYEKLSQVLAEEVDVAVILLDLDNFKVVNDTLGHLFGDKVLQYISSQLLTLETENIFVSRFGGDEFIILYMGTNDVNKIVQFVDRLFDLFKKKIHIDSNEVEIEFSVGISLYPEDSKDVEQLIMNADLSLYSIKNSGKNHYAFFHNKMLDHLISKMNTKRILSEAIANNGFKMVYQPQVDISTGEVIGYEALVRLKDYKKLSPATFIPIAEEDGMIIDIGRIITRLVIEQLCKWKEMGFVLKPVSINFSAVQIHDTSYVEFLLELLELNEISPELVLIEITETSFLVNKEATITFLNDLKSHGVKIAIDDFGTGYSSLSYLTFLPINTIKLDRTLCLKFLEIGNIAVIDSLIALAHSLKMKVIAEGIEELEQVQRLHAGKCDAVQGYYYSKPLEVEDLDAIYGQPYKKFPL